MAITNSESCSGDSHFLPKSSTPMSIGVLTTVVFLPWLVSADVRGRLFFDTGYG